MYAFVERNKSVNISTKITQNNHKLCHFCANFAVNFRKRLALNPLKIPSICEKSFVMFGCCVHCKLVEEIYDAIFVDVYESE